MKILIFVLALVSLRVSAAEQSPAVETGARTSESTLAQSQERRYAIILSKGSGPADFDVFISRNVDHVYTFKYCRAHDLNGKPTKISEIRLKYLMGKLNDSQEAFQYLEETFLSADCAPVEAGTYAYFNDIDLPRCDAIGESAGWSYVGSGLAGVGGLFATFKTNEGIRYARSSNNTESFTHLLFSSRFPHIRGVLSVVFLGASAGFAYLGIKGRPDQDAANTSFSVASFCTIHNKFQTSLRVETSMSEFIKSFKTGLGFAIEDKIFSRL